MNYLVIVAIVGLACVPIFIALKLIHHLEAQIKDLAEANGRLYRDNQGFMEALCAANGQRIALERQKLEVKAERIEQLHKVADGLDLSRVAPYFRGGNGDAVMQSQGQMNREVAERKKN